MKLSARARWFAVAGACGFVADAAVLQALVFAGMGPRAARVVSVPVAITVTWLINRRATFGDRAGPPTLAEFARYVTASAVGLCVNLAVYMGLVTLGGIFRQWPVLALALANVVSLGMNFSSYFAFVFRRPGTQPDDKDR
jgi:putative flippase GtrA